MDTELDDEEEDMDDIDDDELFEDEELEADDADDEDELLDEESDDLDDELIDELIDDIPDDVEEEDTDDNDEELTDVVEILDAALLLVIDVEDKPEDAPPPVPAELLLLPATVPPLQAASTMNISNALQLRRRIINR